MALFTLFAFLLSRVVAPRCARLLERLNRPNLSAVVRAFRRPVFYCMLAVGAYLFICALPFAWLKQNNWPALLRHLLSITIILLLTWGCFTACSVIPLFIRSLGGRFNQETGKALINFVTRICQVVVTLIAISMIFSELGYSISGVLTGLGLGGLSFALAGQELIKNFFGGIILILEHPFEIGDWVSTPDTEGTVEDIALRSTRIRTLDNALTVVPNAKLTEGVITNWTRMKMRLCRFKLGLQYATPRDKVAEVTHEVRAMLESREDVRGETVQVFLTEFGESSLNVSVLFYTKCTQIPEYRAVCDSINLSILTILDKLNVSLAFPSRSVYLENTSRKGGSSV